MSTVPPRPALQMMAATVTASPVVPEDIETTTASTDEEESTEEYQKSLEFVFEVVLLSTVGALGILGNAALLVVFSVQRRAQVKAKAHTSSTT